VIAEVPVRQVDDSKMDKDTPEPVRQDNVNDFNLSHVLEKLDRIYTEIRKLHKKVDQNQKAIERMNTGKDVSDEHHGYLDCMIANIRLRYLANMMLSRLRRDFQAASTQQELRKSPSTLQHIRKVLKEACSTFELEQFRNDGITGLKVICKCGAKKTADTSNTSAMAPVSTTQSCS
jgi:hypothetical protein